MFWVERTPVAQNKNETWYFILPLLLANLLITTESVFGEQVTLREHLRLQNVSVNCDPATFKKKRMRSTLCEEADTSGFQFIDRSDQHHTL